MRPRVYRAAVRRNITTELKRSDVVQEFETNGVRMRDVFLHYTDVVLRDGTRQMSVATEWFNECGVCGATEWVDYFTKEAQRTSSLRFPAPPVLPDPRPPGRGAGQDAEADLPCTGEGYCEVLGRKARSVKKRPFVHQATVSQGTARTGTVEHCDR